MAAPTPEDAAAQLGPPPVFWSPRLGLGVWDTSWKVWRALMLSDSLGERAPEDAMALVVENGQAPPSAAAEELPGVRAVLVPEPLWSTVLGQWRHRGWTTMRVPAVGGIETHAITPGDWVDGGGR